MILCSDRSSYSSGVAWSIHACEFNNDGNHAPHRDGRFPPVDDLGQYAVTSPSLLSAWQFILLGGQGVCRLEREKALSEDMLIDTRLRDKSVVRTVKFITFGDIYGKILERLHEG